MRKRDTPARNYGRRRVAMFSGAVVHQIARMDFGETTYGKRGDTGVTVQSRVSSNLLCKPLFMPEF